MGRKLIIEAIGGLTNRLMAVTSGLRLAMHYGLDFGLSWEPSSECNAEFHDLFENDFPIVKKTKRAVDSHIFVIGHGANGWIVDPVLRVPDDDRDIWLTTHAIIAHSNEPRDRNFSPSQGIIFDIGRYVRALRVRPEILAAAEKFSLTANRTLGLHIRRPYSNNLSLEPWQLANERKVYGVLTDDFFVEIVKRTLSLDPTIDVLLCTNSESTEARLRESLGNKIISQPKTGADDPSLLSSPRGALIDLLLLSKTFGVIHQVHTHFSLFATLMTMAPNLVAVPGPETSSADLVLIRWLENGHIDVERGPDAIPKLVLRRYNFYRY